MYNKAIAQANLVRTFGVLGFLALLCAPSIYNFGYGLGENIDTYLILERALAFPKEGYVPARSWGNPLYEIVIYPLISYFGTTVAKVYSFAWVMIAQFAFHKILTRYGLKGLSLFLSNLLFAIIPIRIVSGNTILETSQGAGLALVGLYFLFTVWKDEKPSARNAILIGFFWACAIATRIPYLILPIAATFSISYSLSKIGGRKKAYFLCVMWCTALIGLLPYKLLYHSAATLGNQKIFETGDLIWMRILKTVIGYVASLGIPASLAVLTGFLIYLYRSPIDKVSPRRIIASIRKQPLVVFFGFITILYLFRMLILPDELEYIYFWTVFLILMLALFIRNPVLKSLMIVLLALPNFFRVHLFERNQDTSSIEFSVGISPGTLAQERERRLLNEDIRQHGDQYLGAYLKELGCHKSLRHTDFFVEKLGSRTSHSDCILASKKWYSRLRDYVLPSQGKSMENMIPGNEGKILVHPVPVDRGWRRLLKYTSGVDSLQDVQGSVKVIEHD